MSILQFSNVTAGYGNTAIVRDMNLQLESGKILCILGRNGVGKSTLLKTLMGIIPNMSGEINFDGKKMTHLKPYQIERLGVAYAAQESAIFPSLTVEGNLKIGFNKGKKLFQKNCEKVFSYFPILKERWNQKSGTLSGGEQKMLLMARSFIRSPKLLVLDEITEGVQPSIIDKIKEAIVFANKEMGISVLLIEQNINFALHLSDKFIVMDQGAIRDSGVVTSNTVQKIEQLLSI